MIKSIPGFSNYSVDDTGRVFGRRGRELCQSLSHDGYKRIGIFNDDGVRKTVKTHRLVLYAFFGPCPAGQEGRHLDGDRLNNNVSNLAWGTKAENGKDKRRHERSYNNGNESARHVDRDTKSIVVEMRERAAAGESVRSFYAEYGVSYAYARKIVNGSVWSKLPGAVKRTTCGKVIRR